MRASQDQEKVRLTEGSPYYGRKILALAYVISLQDDSLLQNFYLEAGIRLDKVSEKSSRHQGWEDPTCQLRGHFLGHWLSAMAHFSVSVDDPRIRGRIDHVVRELALCQKENGGRWVGPIPEKYLDWVARGKTVWAPHYTLHKVLMGLIDVARELEHEQALTVAAAMAAWLDDWSRDFSQSQMQDILDVESGGMMEAFADLYSLTGKTRDLNLMRRYARDRYFDRILAGEDVLSNQHANTTIPEIHGACRAYEITGEKRWLDIAQAYWDLAVTRRQAFVTGGQTLGEIWTPPDQMGPRLGGKNQEHCTVYNMIRLADYLNRFAPDKAYADYIELAWQNGVLAQCFWQGFTSPYDPQFNSQPTTTTVSYFLPLQPGARKPWGSETDHFWCCHGSAIQACAGFERLIYERSNGAKEPIVTINQYIPSTYDSGKVHLSLKQDLQKESLHHPTTVKWQLHNRGQATSVRLRLPAWLTTRPEICLDDKPFSPKEKNGYLEMTLSADAQLEIGFPESLTVHRLPGSNRYAFRYGPRALAALTANECLLPGRPQDFPRRLVFDGEREWEQWQTVFRTTGLQTNLTFKPLQDIGLETYTTYFEFESPNDRS